MKNQKVVIRFDIKACAEEFPVLCDDACQAGALLELRRSLDPQVGFSGD